MRTKLVFVDDERLLLNALERSLSSRAAEWDMSFYDCPLRAWERLQVDPVDVVVSDVTMPGMDGLELLTRMQMHEMTQDTPVIIVTGREESSLKSRALDMGAMDLMYKPVDGEDLRARVQNALRLKQYADELKQQRAMLDRQVQARTRELSSSRLEVVWRLAKAAECRDNETGNHVVRVATYSRLVATALGMDQPYCETLLLAATLHDIGKIGVPDAVLRKPGKLNAAEWQIMRQHCEMGRAILADGQVSPALHIAGVEPDCYGQSNPLLRMAAEIAASHHEWWDGTGYPHGLKGDDIPLAGRIVAIADVYDALRSSRPYKAAFSTNEALDIITQDRGTHFDPDVYDAFLLAFDDIRAVECEAADEVPWSPETESGLIAAAKQLAIT